MSADRRGWRMALVSEALVNPSASQRAALPDVLGVLETSGYGVLQLPPPGDHALLLAVIADQVAEYVHHGYAVAAVGIQGEPGKALYWRRLASLLQHRSVALPPRHLIRPEAGAAAESQRLATFLTGYDIPVEQQQHWRV
jgi:hypothetical protein